MFLGNNADDFMTAKMPVSVSTQEGRAQKEMPAPRDTARVGNEQEAETMIPPPRAAQANSFLPGLGDNNEMLPGMGSDEMLPGMGNDEMLPGMGGIMDRLTSPAGLLVAGGALFYLFGTKGGKKMRKSIGLG